MHKSYFLVHFNLYYLAFLDSSITATYFHFGSLCSAIAVYSLNEPASLAYSLSVSIIQIHFDWVHFALLCSALRATPHN